MSDRCYIMKQKNNKKIKSEAIEINANSPNHEIRSFFVNTAIETIQYMTKKAYHGRIRDEEHEKIKIQQLKLIINACNVGNRVLKDRQLDEYEKDLNALKEGLMLNANVKDDMIEVSPLAIAEIEALDEKLDKIKEGE